MATIAEKTLDANGNVAVRITARSDSNLSEHTVDGNGAPALRVATTNIKNLNEHTVDENGAPALRMICEDGSVGGGEPVAKTKYGISIDNIIGDVNANGIPLFGELFSFVGTGIIELSGDYKFGYRFYATTWDRVYFPDLVRIGNGASALSDSACCQSSFGYNRYTGDSVVVDMPKLESIDGNYVAQNMFTAGYVEEINLPKLQIIKGIQAAGRMFSSCKVKNVSLPSLTTISGQSAAQSMFTNCKIESIDLSSLTTVSGSSACREMFEDNPNLIRADFPSLTTITDANALGTSSSNGMFTGCTGCGCFGCRFGYWNPSRHKSIQQKRLQQRVRQRLLWQWPRLWLWLRLQRKYRCKSF